MDSLMGSTSKYKTHFSLFKPCPSLSARKHSIFQESWCEVKASHEFVLEFSNSNFMNATSKVTYETAADGEVFVFVSDKARLSFDKRRKMFRSFF